MNLNQDRVPIDLEECLKLLKEALSVDEIAEIKKPTFSPEKVHFSVGMFLRNEWSLWDAETILVKWFERTYGVTHPDDISGIVLECLKNDIKGEPRRDKELAAEFIEHWKNQQKKIDKPEDI
jgi:hypothetical protein